MHTRLEYRDSASEKFWEIRVKGNSHTVRFGRTGTQGQTKQKAFASPAQARKDAEKLIASKIKKGYTQASRAKTKTAGAKTPARKTSGKGKSELTKVLAEIEKFVQRLEKSGRFGVSRDKPIKPPSPATIKAVERAYGQPVPEQLLEFWGLGFRNVSITPMEELNLPETGGSTDFIDAAYVKKTAAMHRGSEEMFREYRATWHNDNPAPESLREKIELAEIVRLEARSMNLSHHSPFQVVEVDPLGQPGSVHISEARHGFLVPLEPVAPDIATFLMHYAAVGFFDYGSQDLLDPYWDAVKDLVPFDIPRSENLYLLHLDRWYKPGYSKTRKKYKPCPLPRWTEQERLPPFPGLLDKLNEAPGVLTRIAGGGTFVEIFDDWAGVGASGAHPDYVFFGSSHDGLVGMRKEANKKIEQREIVYRDTESNVLRKCAPNLEKFLVEVAKGRSAYSMTRGDSNAIREPVPELIQWLLEQKISLPSTLAKELNREAPKQIRETLRYLADHFSRLKFYSDTRALPWDALPGKRIQPKGLIFIGEAEEDGYIALHKSSGKLLTGCPVLFVPNDPECKPKNVRLAESLMDFLVLLARGHGALSIARNAKPPHKLDKKLKTWLQQTHSLTID